MYYDIYFYINCDSHFWKWGLYPSNVLEFAWFSHEGIWEYVLQHVPQTLWVQEVPLWP